MSDSASFSSRCSIIVDQLSYLIDELEAQRPWILRIPDVQLHGKPLDTAPSLFEMYQGMRNADLERHLPLLGIPYSTPASDSASLSDVIDQIQHGRKALVDFLSSLSQAEWSQNLGDTESDIIEYAFQITQRDSTFLKGIAERLHESMITFSR